VFCGSQWGQAIFAIDDYSYDDFPQRDRSGSQQIHNRPDRVTHPILREALALNRNLKITFAVESPG